SWICLSHRDILPLRDRRCRTSRAPADEPRPSHDSFEPASRYETAVRPADLAPPAVEKTKHAVAELCLSTPSQAILSTRAIAALSLAQSSVSVSSCFRPAAVRE